MAEAYIIDAARTFRGLGKAGKGAVSHIHPQRLLGEVFKAVEKRNDLNTSELDDVVVGCSTELGRVHAPAGRPCGSATCAARSATRKLRIP